MIPEKLGNKENPKRNTQDPPGKGKQIRPPEKIRRWGEKKQWKGQRERRREGKRIT